MYGIAGAINFNKICIEALKKALSHRGSDKQDIYTDKNIALLHTRLSIQDISGGK